MFYLVVILLIIILIGIIVSQGVAIIKLVKEIRNRETKKGISYNIFRGIWLVVDSIAFMSIILWVYTVVKSCTMVYDVTNQAYGWVPFIVFLYVLVPVNVLATGLRMVYLNEK